LVGTQVAREAARRLHPDKIVVASLYQREVRESLSLLKKEFADVQWVGVWGDVFVRAELSGARRRDLIQSQQQASAAQLARLRKSAQRAFDTLVIAQGLPRLVRHVVFIVCALEEVGTRVYLKVGTTGT
jgi:hypothetical protein